MAARLLLVAVAGVAGVTSAALALAFGDDGPPRGGGAATSRASDPPGFHPPRVGSVARVWAVGDAALEGERPRRVARLIAAGRPELFLYLGDVYPDGTAEDFEVYDRLYGRLARRTAPTLGNHEWHNRRRGYDRYWSRALGRHPPRYYAFRAAGWTLLSMNSEVPPLEMRRQARWLREQVRGGGTCRLAFWHRPRYSAALHGDSPRVEPLWRALRSRARLVVNGHEHDLQRMRRRDGITQLVAGAGGNERYTLGRDPRRVFGNDSVDGALRLVLRPGRASYAFVSAGGRVLHRGSARCRGG